MGADKRAGGKPFAIDYGLVVRAWLKTRENGGAPGVDGQGLDEFEADLDNNLYKLWNRMSSGSYFPRPVRGVDVPKADGGVRVLGIPTVADRVAQTAAAMVLEPDFESVFADSSYGFRPGRGALDAVAAAEGWCRKLNWVLDLDIAKFFDTVDHGLLMRALEWREPPAWVLLYVRRWGTAPMVAPDGSVVERAAGTPQGGPVSPVLANLFLHVALDSWMAREFPDVPFERYADDAVFHCRTRREAERLREAVAGRLAECGLAAHPDKTRVVYCKDTKRSGGAPPGVAVKFTFLGFEFRARTCRNRITGRLFDGFGPGIDPAKLRGLGKQVRHWRLRRWNQAAPGQVREFVNQRVWAWCNYYGRFRPSELRGLLRQVNAAVMGWMRAKYRHLRPWGKALRKWRWLVKYHPRWLLHWQLDSGLARQ